ncbi:MAG: L,D-transpeptidase family protein [Sphingomonadaceae bacterium]|nr:L,D-transpeptidase family protein [Sphingomonadaceae bacterium]
MALALAATPFSSTWAEDQAVPPPAAPAAAPVMPAPAALAAPAPAPVVPPMAVPDLDPGDFVWHPERSAAGPVEIVVSIPDQLVYVYRGGTLIAASTVSTGRPGHRTPTGDFRILEKDRNHHSNKYNNAPMPFMQRLTMDGIALHAGQIPGHPASHGCVRLPLAFARNLFGVTAVGANVHILGASVTPETALRIARNELPASIQIASR